MDMCTALCLSISKTVGLQRRLLNKKCIFKFSIQFLFHTFFYCMKGLSIFL